MVISFEMKNEKNKPIKFSKKELTMDEKRWVRKLENTIHKHLRDTQFSIDFLSKKLGISRRQLQRNLKKTTGLSPKIFIKEYRLNLAFNLLENRKVESVQEVANHVGYLDRDYFSKKFKDRFGMLPSKFIIKSKTD